MRYVKVLRGLREASFVVDLIIPNNSKEIANTPKEQHQTLLTILEFGVKIATAGIGLGFSAILLSYPMIAVIAIMLVISIIAIILSVLLYRSIPAEKRGSEIS